MDIREYFKKEQRGFYNIFAKTLTVERRKQLYNAINDWHERELKLLGIADVVGQSEQLCDFLEWYDEKLTLEEREMDIKTYLDMKSHNCH